MDRSFLAGRDLSGAIAAKKTGVSARAPRPLSSFPATYDLRSYGKLTAVRNQGSYGDCWAFATLASVESALLPGETADYSENNIAMNSGFYRTGDPMNEGGNSFMSTAYLARWNGPVNQADDPHDGVKRAGLTVRKHLQDMFWLPPAVTYNETAFKNNMKSAVQTYGAVFTSIWWDDGFSKTNDTTYYTPNCSEPYGTGGADACACSAPGNCGGHAVAIVGWNDNYSASNFKVAPPGNGAFIARNSWGTSSGESGYFYISYYDTSLGGESAVFHGNEAVSNYSDVYQYDTLGYVYEVGNGDVAGPSGDSLSEWMANIFTASDSGFLRAVSFYTTDVNATYELYVYTNVTAGQPRSGTLAYTYSTSFAMPGYHTVPLYSDVVVTGGQRFSVVVKLTNPENVYPLAVETRTTQLSDPYNYSGDAAASAGQSYISRYGSSWTDLTTVTNSYYGDNFANANVALKAFVQSDATPPSDIATVNDGTGADASQTGSTSQLSANWTASSDAGSGIAAYYYAIGTSQGSADVVDWTSAGTAQSVTRSALSLTQGQTYYFGVKAVNGVGLYSNATWSNGILVNANAPEDIPYVNDGLSADKAYVSSTGGLAANWGTTNFIGGTISSYYYAIGTTRGGTNVVGWTNNALATSVTRTGLSLSEGTTYYFAVIAYNNLGNPSATATSDGQLVDITSPTAQVILTSPQPAGNGVLTGRLALSEHGVRIASAPALSFNAPGGQNVPLTLSYLTGSTWTFTGYVDSYVSSGAATFSYSARDLAGNTGSVITLGGGFTISALVDATAGAYFANSDTMTVSLPAGAYSGTMRVTITTVAASVTAAADAAASSRKPAYLDLVREFRAFTPIGGGITSFAQPVTLTMAYPDADSDGRIDGELIDEGLAHIYYLDPLKNEWTPVPGCTRDTAANTVSGQVSHFSVYSLRALTPSQAQMSLKAYPNPCPFAERALTIAGIPISASSVKVYIYNTAGELVHTLSQGDGVSALNEVSWNGRLKNGSRAATGVYLYLVKTANQGSASGKFFGVW